MMTTNTFATVNAPETTLTASERAFQEESLRRLRSKTFKSFHKSSAAERTRETFVLMCKLGLLGDK